MGDHTRDLHNLCTIVNYGVACWMVLTFTDEELEEYLRKRLEADRCLDTIIRGKRIQEFEKRYEVDEI